MLPPQKLDCRNAFRRRARPPVLPRVVVSGVPGNGRDAQYPLEPEFH